MFYMFYNLLVYIIYIMRALSFCQYSLA